LFSAVIDHIIIYEGNQKEIVDQRQHGNKAIIPHLHVSLCGSLHYV